MKQLVIMPGGFHPFHAGHLALYNAAVKAFPNADVYVAATADTSERPFPFKFKQQLAKLAGVPADRFVQVKSPFRAQEIVSKYDPEDTQLIFVRSDKDKESQPRPGGVKKDGSPSYLQPYTEKEQLPLTQRGYMAYLPTVEFGPGMKSATEIRAAWPSLSDKRKQALVMSLYPATQKNPKLAQKAVEIFDQVLSPVTENQGWAATLERKDSNKDDVVAAAEKDPALLSALRHAKQHYQQHRDDPVMAFMKWVQRSLMHSEIEDQTQDQKIRELEDKVRELISQSHQRETVDETTLVNDPDRGMLIRPEGGMGTWTEQSLVTRLQDYIQDMQRMLADGDYRNLYFVIQPNRAMAAMIKSLADLQNFREKQGRRPVGRGREIQVGEETGVMAGTPAVGGMKASYQARENQPVMDYIEEKWSEKYKRSINCNNPRGFSQKAHCAGRKK